MKRCQTARYAKGQPSGERGRRSGTRRTLGRPPPLPLRFSLCTLFPQTSLPLPATAMRLLESLLIAVTIVSFNGFLERASRSLYNIQLFSVSRNGRTMCAPTEKMRKTPSLCGKSGRETRPLHKSRGTVVQQFRITNSEFTQTFSPSDILSYPSAVQDSHALSIR